MPHAAFNPTASDLLDISHIEDELAAQTPIDDSGLAGARWLGRALGLMLLSTIALWPVTNLGFLWNDAARITEDRTLKSTLGLKLIWTEPFHFRSADLPLGQTLFWVEYDLFGSESAAGYHAVSLFLHAVNAVLIWSILRRLGLPAPWICAAIWAVHPLMATPVSLVSQQPMLLAVTFALISCVCCLDQVNAGGSTTAVAPSENNCRRIWVRAIPTCFFAIVAALTCPLVLIVILAVVVTSVWRGNSLTYRQLCASVMAVVAGLTFIVLQISNHRWSWHSDGKQLLFLLPALLQQIKHFLFFSQPHVVEFGAWGVLSAIAIAIGILSFSWVCYMYGKRHAFYALTIVTFALLTSLPTVHVQFLALQYPVVGDRYLGSAVPALLLVVVCVYCISCFSILSRHAFILRTSFAIVGICVFAAQAIHRTQSFASEELVWRNTLARDPEFAVAQIRLADFSAKSGRHGEAIEFLSKLTALESTNPVIAVGLAQELERAGRTDEADTAFGSLVRLAPKDAELHVVIGEYFFRRGALDGACLAFTAATRLDATSESASVNLGGTLLTLGRPDEALKALNDGLVSHPNSVRLHLNTAAALRALGRLTDAGEHLRKVVEIEPFNFDAVHRAAILLHESQRFREAEIVARSALALRPGSASAFETLGFALAAQGKPDEAKYFLKRAIEASTPLPPG